MTIAKILERYAEVAQYGVVMEGLPNYQIYATSNLRGGAGKSTLTFNLAHEIAKSESLLVADLCPQCNLTETFMRETVPEVTIAHALLPRVLGPAFGTAPADITYKVSRLIDEFKRCKPTYLIPGDSELFAFPSQLYQQLQQAATRPTKDAVTNLLLSLRELLVETAEELKCDRILMDTSPFYAGGTHLAWCAADALVVPVRVDEHSLASLELMCEILTDRNRDFWFWNSKAENLAAPKIAAIVLTMAGSKSREAFTPDQASRMYIERAYDIATRFSKLFDHDDIADAIIVTDDFVSAGRISGAKSIPISRLQVNSFHRIDGKRLQVNQSVERYSNELRYLSSAI